MIEFRYLGIVDNPRAHVHISGITESLRERTLDYCYTVGGSKLHLAWSPGRRTLCGSVPWQLVLVEEPVPDSAVCDWCRAGRDKETR